ncbi:GNAT family N-acetyltransferase [Devosia sp. SL43]|uniref:GNAT family N-acetyltransferase n=1 Tax=Devosia sp. SL43 TaxID=2806348 RepID=UPI001F4045DB|nr:GNAT family N-acetyltransferase [Devosia sp. SL43]UJW83927.1 GNAT family N-acetyltransferase [Devosia sp. SL43]
MRHDQYQTKEALEADAELLAGIRVEAMRPSLEAVGRFDLERARDRFLKSFRPDDTQIICEGEAVVGFYVVQRHSDHLYLDHLYVTAQYQGRGVGRRIIDELKVEATMSTLPIRLTALNGSPANSFYQKCGFRVVSTDALDTIYEWQGTIDEDGTGSGP